MLLLRLTHYQQSTRGLNWSSRLLILAVVMILSVGIALLATEQFFVAFLGLVMGVAMLGAILRWPPVGLLALLVASLAVPFEVATGTYTTLNPAVLLLMVLTPLWVIGLMARNGVQPWAPERPSLALIAYLVVALLSFGAGQLGWIVFAQSAPLTAQLGGLAVFALSVGAFLLVATQIRSLRWLKGLTWLFLGLGGVYVATRLISSVWAVPLSIFPKGATQSPFWIWLIALAFAQALFNTQLSRRWRISLLFLVVATLGSALFLSVTWASGWLPPMIAMFVIVWIGAPRAGLLLTIAGGIAAIFKAQEFAGLLLINEQYSLLTRMEAWRILGEIIKASPVLGLGPANYYFYTPLYPILGWNVSFSSHNQYVDIAAQTGLLGLILFLWFALEIGRLAWGLRNRVLDGFSHAYVLGALGGLAATLAAGMMGDVMFPFVYNLGISSFRSSVLIWIFLGGLVAIKKIHLRHAETIV